METDLLDKKIGLEVRRGNSLGNSERYHEKGREQKRIQAILKHFEGNSAAAP